MQHRYTIKVIASGQPRAYADSISVVQIQFEHSFHTEGDLKPHYVSEATARRQLLRMECGFFETIKRERIHGLDPYLEYLNPMNPKTAAEIISGGNPKQILSDVWEFKTVHPFTD